jgi:hypothetical protein
VASEGHSSPLESRKKAARDELDFVPKVNDASSGASLWTIYTVEILKLDQAPLEARQPGKSAELIQPWQAGTRMGGLDIDLTVLAVPHYFLGVN